MDCCEATEYLTNAKYRGCKWQMVTGCLVHAVGRDFQLSGFEAIAIAKELQREAKPKVAGFSVPWNHGFSYVGNAPKNGEDLGPLEWRKQVDYRLDALAGWLKKFDDIEYTRECHNDRFQRGETKAEEIADRLDDLESTESRTRAEVGSHEYKIKAWGECVSDALRKIVAQDERIAKLEADIDRIVKLGCGIESENEKFKSRLDRLESSAFSLAWLPAKVSTLEDVITEAVADTVEAETFHALEQRVAAITKKVNELADESDCVGGLAF